MKIGLQHLSKRSVQLKDASWKLAYIFIGTFGYAGFNAKRILASVT
jgi:hypothetical protein